MKRVALFITFILTLMAFDARSQETQADCIQNSRRKIEGRRVYAIGISENTETYEINEKLSNAESRAGENTRGIIDDLFLSYRGAFSRKTVSTVDMLIDAGINEVAELVRDHRKDWKEAVLKECSFRKSFKMNQEISDFYCKMSPSGAMDLSDIAFRGFSFRQQIRYNDPEAAPLEVFYAYFSLDTTEVGIDRMVHHSKFQVVLDSLRFNPYLCEIPNDSVVDPSQSIGFDFAKRKDLVIRLNTVLKSSWICENMNIIRDYPLGEFLVEAHIDPALLDPADSCFKYSIRNPSDSVKMQHIKCSGEAFMVPRSYIGLIDDVAYWGTGQYRLEMNLSENCSINDSYYLEEDPSGNGKKKWNRKAWKEEWRLIRRRRGFAQSHLSKALHQVTSQWSEGQWVTEIFTPGTTVLVSTGQEYLQEVRLNNTRSGDAKSK